jgi:F0F1-type ATP synthase membrane subunit b/b'
MRQFEERGIAARRRVEDELRRRRAQGKSELGARAGRAGTQIRENATDLAAKLQEIVSSVGADVPTESS